MDGYAHVWLAGKEANVANLVKVTLITQATANSRKAGEKKEKKRQCNKIELKCSEGRHKGERGESEVGGRTLIMTPTHGENVEREHVNPMEVNADGIGRREEGRQTEGGGLFG